MKKSTKRIFAAMLAATLFTSVFAGCSQSSSESSTGNDSSGSEAEKQEVMELEVYLNYDWWVVNTPFDGSDEISKWIIENKGVKLNFTNPGGDPNEKMNIMIATDTFPDTIMMERDSNAKKLVDLGKIVRLDDYIEKYPGYKSVVDEETLAVSSYDGGVYNILNWPLDDEWTGLPRLYFLNQQIYEDLGSPSLDSTEDFYNYLKAVKEADLNVNGQPVVPLQGDAGNAPGSVWLTCFDGGLAGYDLVDDRLIYPFRKEGTLEGLKFLNRLYNDGLINKDCFSEQQEQINEKVLNGRVAVYMTDTSATAVEPANTSYREGKSDFCYTYSAKFPAPNGKKPSDIYSNTYNKLGWNALYITTDCEDPERAYEFFDWLITPEGQNVVAFGPKGILWDEVDEEQVPILKEGKTLSLSEEEAKTLPLATFQFLGNSVYYDYAKLKMNNALPEDEQNESMKWQYDALNDPESSKKKDITAFTGTTLSQDDPEFAIDQDVTNYILDQYTKILTGSPDDVEKLYNETLEGMDAKGAKQVEDKWTAIYQENYEKYFGE